MAIVRSGDRERFAWREGSVAGMLFVDVREDMYLTDGWSVLEVIGRRIGDHRALSTPRRVLCVDAFTEQLVVLREHELARYWELQAW